MLLLMFEKKMYVITKKLISMLSTKIPKSKQQFFSRPFYRGPKIIKRTRFPFEFNVAAILAITACGLLVPRACVCDK